MKNLTKLMTLTILFSVILMSCSTKETTTETDENTLRVGIDLKFPPFMYEDENNNPTGLEPELARAFGDYLGMNVEIVNTDFSMLIPALQTGEVDVVISDISVTPEREKSIDFSIPYRYGRTPVLVNKDFYDNNNVTDEMSASEFFNIKGAKFIGLSGTVGTIIPSRYGVEADEATEKGTAIMEVATGQSDAIVGSYVVFGDHHANPDTTEIYLGIEDSTPSAFAFKKGNTQMVEKANEFIETLYQDGGLYEQLAEKYDDEINKVFFSDGLGLDYIVSKSAK
ncbi:MAG: transporter substrate-binding domain-containing protein [Sphaerochaeta sp.]